MKHYLYCIYIIFLWLNVFLYLKVYTLVSLSAFCLYLSFLVLPNFRIITRTGMTDIWISFFPKRRQGLTLQMMVPEVLQRAIKLGFTFKEIKVFLIVNLHIREDSGFHV